MAPLPPPSSDKGVHWYLEGGSRLNGKTTQWKTMVLKVYRLQTWYICRLTALVCLWRYRNNSACHLLSSIESVCGCQQRCPCSWVDLWHLNSTWPGPLVASYRSALLFQWNPLLFFLCRSLCSWSILYRKFNEQRGDWSSDLLIIPMNNLIQPLYFIDGETEAQTTGGVYIQLPFLDSRLLQCHGEFQRSVWCGEKKRRGHFFKSLSDIGKWVKSKNWLSCYSLEVAGLGKPKAVNQEAWCKVIYTNVRHLISSIF